MRRQANCATFALLLISQATAFAADAQELEEVVVTARRTEEALSRVPLSIDAWRGEELRRASVQGLQDIAALEPGLSFESFWGGANAAPVIRGQSQPSTAGDNVGVFLDGVYQGLRGLVDVEMLDLARVEVARGPQSALFGRSTFAGAISYVPQAPTGEFAAGGALDLGTDNLRGIEAYVSGPLADRWTARLAGGVREADGSLRNEASQGATLGDYQRLAGAATLVYAGDGVFDARLHLRAQRNRDGQPAVATIGFAKYNCGGRDAAGYWSYFCGPLPVSSEFSLSTDTPESHASMWQAAAHLAWRLGSLTLTSETSVYDAAGESFRDFDASDTGETLGVCTAGVNCGLPGGAQQVNRLVGVNVVSRSDADVREWSQELRLSGAMDVTLQWQVGALWARRDETSGMAFGAGAGDLGSNEQWTALLPAQPLRVGPVSRFNRARVVDPVSAQVQQGLAQGERTVFALFGAVDYAWAASWRLRAEARWNQEREQIDSVLANYSPGFGTALGTQSFTDVTPRVSLQWIPEQGRTAWLSLAKGSRSGGINAIPGLLPEEQGYEPESNWTGEFGGRWQWPGARLTANGAVYYIDWRDTQILDISNTPGVSNLITRNTAGIITRGMELALAWRPLEALTLQGSYSLADPRFRQGSDDPGSRAFCGITAASPTSSFCTVGPSRTAAVSTLPVAWLDGNVPGRAVRESWAAMAEWRMPELSRGLRPWLRADIGHQDDVFDRGINGSQYGARTLFNARVALEGGSWSLELWGRNLTDERYIRALSSRGAVYYPTQPRPLDLIHAEGRQVGLTLRFER